MTGLRVTWRIAKRTVFRHKFAHALLVSMIALPLVFLTIGLTQQQSTSNNPEIYVKTRVGAAARIDFRRDSPIMQDSAGNQVERNGPALGEAETLELAAYERLLLGAFSTTAQLTRSVEVPVSFKSGLLATDPVPLQISSAAGETLPFAVTGLWPSSADEIALSKNMANRLAVSLGDAITIADRGDGTQVQVVGVLEGAGDVAAFMSVTPITEIVPDFSSNPRNYSWYLTQQEALTWTQVTAVNEIGASVTSPEILRANQPNHALALPSSFGFQSLMMLGAGVLVLLLCTPAFLVNASRGRKDSALLHASGATRGQLPLIQSLGGVIVGLIGGGIGVSLGVLAATGLFVSGNLPGAPLLSLPWNLVVPLMFLAVVAAVLGANLASIGITREPVAAAIADRSLSAKHPRARFLRFGLFTAGVGLAVWGVVSGVNYIVGAGIIFACFGIFAVTGPLLDLLSRRSDGFPLPSRLGLRDAARHPRRTLPALLIIVALSTGITGVAVYAQSAAASGESTYHSANPYGAIEIAMLPLPGGYSELGTQRVPALVDDLISNLAPSSVSIVNTLKPARTDDLDAAVQIETTSGFTMLNFDSIVVDEGTNIELLGFVDSQAAGDALTHGKLVVSDASFIQADGTVSMQITNGAPVAWPASYVSSPGESLYFVIPPVLVETLGQDTQASRILLGPSIGTDAFSEKQADLARSLAASYLAPDAAATVSLELGYQPDLAVQAMRLLVLSTIILGALLAAILSVLAVRDQSFELRILNAVGATPQTVGRISAVQSATVTGFGTLLGCTVGAMLACLVVLGFSRSDSTWQLAVPWVLLILVTVGGPILGGFISGVVARLRIAKDSSGMITDRA